MQSGTYRLAGSLYCLNMNSLSIEQRICCVCERRVPKVIRINTATAQEPLKWGDNPSVDSRLLDMTMHSGCIEK